MRLAIFFLYLFFNLQCGANHVCAATQDGNTNSSLISRFVQRDQVKFVKSNTGNVIFSEASLDLEEENSNDDAGKNKTLNKSFTGKFGLSKIWYLTVYCQSVLNYYDQNLKIFAPSCGQSTPIYITLRVLRI